MIDDADLQFGDVCISLQIDPRHTIVDVEPRCQQLLQLVIGQLIEFLGELESF